MKPVPDAYDKNNPGNWINRPMNGYPREKKNLMVRAEKKNIPGPPPGGFVTDIRYGITLTLCRRIIEDGEDLAVPVGREEAVLWNVPLTSVFNDAVCNTAKLFPPAVYDLSAGRYIELARRTADENRYDFEGTSSMAAENREVYQSGCESGLRFIVSTSNAVGDAIIFYPGLMRELAYKLRKNPTVLICGPGKMFVFDSGKRKKGIRNYIERYKDYIGDPSYDPYLFRYIKENNALMDLTKDAEPRINPLSEAHIPQGSIASAWGDVSYRRDMLDWKRGKNH